MGDLDLFAALEPRPDVAAIPKELAKRVILGRAKNGEVTHAILLVKSNMGLSYCASAAILRELVEEGFISVADQDGRRQLLRMGA